KRRFRFTSRELYRAQNAPSTARRAILVGRGVGIDSAAAGSDADAALRDADEGDEMTDVVGRRLGLHAVERAAEMHGAREERRDRTANRGNALGAESRTAETDDVHRPYRVCAVDDAVWRNVAARPRQAAHQRQRPDPDVLMHDAVAGDE